MASESNHPFAANGANPRQSLAHVTGMVLKVGTNVILSADGSVDRGVLDSLTASISALRQAGREVVLVSSGAVGLGAHRLGLASPLHRSMCAAIGQSLLTSLYNEAFARHGLVMAQLLVTSDDFLDEVRSASLRDTLRRMLAMGVVPMLNENDAVSQHAVMPPRVRLFHDNDQLAALVAKLIETKLLILLTDVDGLYTLHPAHSDAELIAELESITSQHLANAGGGGPRGRGGMRSKLQAIESALQDPVLIAVIANGRRPGVLEQILAGESVGTVIGASRAARD